MKLKAGTIKRIHVDKRVIMSNLKHGRNDPPITVQTSKGPLKAYAVEVKGSSKFLYADEYSGLRPLSCGARLWIETRAEVVLETAVSRSRARNGESISFPETGLCVTA